MIAIIVVIAVWNSNIHKNPKYRSLLNLLTSLTILFSSFAIILQIYTFNASQTDDLIKINEQMFDDLFEAISTYFETNPKMNYYYSEMFRPLNYNETTSSENRLYTEERQVTSSIMQKIASIVYFLENDKSLTPEEKSYIEGKLNKFITNMVNSPIFIENYNNIKLNFVSPSLTEYMQQHFNI
jgi:hypothetical protein